MEKEEYKKMYDLGKAHWWFLGSENLVTTLLEKYLPRKKSLKLLDLGCGPGRMIDSLKRFGEVFGADVEEEAINYCRMRGCKNLYLSDAAALPFNDTVFDAIVIVDLLYHERADDKKILKEANRVLKKDGLLFVNECAFEALRSRHDTAMHAKKRFEMHELKALLSGAGFGIIKASYWNFFLFPFVAVARIFFRNSGGKDSDISETPKIINWILKNILFLENKIIEHVDFPWGVSVVCVAKKK